LAPTPPTSASQAPTLPTTPSPTTNSSLAITAKPLIITGGNSSLTYNAATQTNTTAATISGLVNGESITVTGYGAGRNVGTYNDLLIAVAGANTDLDNYAITTVNGKLTITPYQLNFGPGSSGPRLVADLNSKAYDGSTDISGSLSVQGLLGNDSLTASASNLSLNNANVGNQTRQHLWHHPRR